MDCIRNKNISEIRKAESELISPASNMFYHPRLDGGWNIYIAFTLLRLYEYVTLSLQR